MDRHAHAAKRRRRGAGGAQLHRRVGGCPIADGSAGDGAPHKGRSVTVAAERGKILVRVPNSRRYVPIGSLTEIPLGLIIDARRGRARITTEVDARTGRTQSAVFYSWFFRILQTKGSKPITEARLVKGSFAGCTPRRSTRPKPASAANAAAGLRAQSAATRKRSKRRVRHLWGRGNGSFRTGGKRSAATVRGTTWLVQDRCDATITRVKVGRVDFRRKKTIPCSPRRGARPTSPRRLDRARGRVWVQAAKRGGRSRDRPDGSEGASA